MIEGMVLLAIPGMHPITRRETVGGSIFGFGQCMMLRDVDHFACRIG